MVVLESEIIVMKLENIEDQVIVNIISILS